MSDHGRDSNGYYPGDVDRYYHSDTNHNSSSQYRKRNAAAVWISAIVVLIGAALMDQGLWLLGIPVLLFGLLMLSNT